MKKKIKSSNNPNLHDTDHPFRKTAIRIIEKIIEPLMQRGIDGSQYYLLEDNLTNEINKNLKKLICHGNAHTAKTK